LNGEPQAFERSLTRPSGAISHTLTSYIPDVDASGRTLGFYVLASDVTALKQAEIKLLETNVLLEAARDRAEAATAVKSEFLANMSHEIRTPLNGMLGMAQAMAHDPLPPKQRERLEVVLQSGEGLVALLNNFLDLSKIEAGMMELETVEFDLAETVNAACAPFELIARRKGVGFTVSVDESVGRRRGDATRLRQIVLNLVSNAVKFTTDGQVEVLVYAEADTVWVGVSDTGLGMSPETTERMFEKFVQADVSTTRRFGGTGLGLALCSDLARLMGGTVTASSEVGKGSVFLVSLPLAWVEPKVSLLASAGLLTADVGTLRVLAAEDNEINQIVLTTLLEQAGIDVVIARNGLEAIEAWRGGCWDVILMDVQMPIMDGPTATGAIRAAEAAEGRRRTPIIALTANSMDHQVAEYLAAGMDAVVSKPIKVEALFAALEAVLAADPVNGAPEAPRSAA
jgi:signal transduction histidine kinase/CheY-like chemotaxis protein